MSLDVYLTLRKKDVFGYNITHNLRDMAIKAGAYDLVWHPPEKTKAKTVRPVLAASISKMESDPDHFRKYNPPNGWGTYEDLLQFFREYLEACEKWPNATVSAYR